MSYWNGFSLLESYEGQRPRDNINADAAMQQNACTWAGVLTDSKNATQASKL